MTEAQLEALIREYRGPLYRYARRFLRDDRDVEEVLNDVFYQAAKTLDPSSPTCRSWLFKVTRNHCFDRLRKAQRMPQAVSLSDPEGNSHSYARSLPASISAVAGIVTKEIQSLPDRDRALFEMRFGHHLSLPEIGRILGVRPGTVGAMLHKLKRNMRERLRTYPEAQAYFEQDNRGMEGGR